MDTALTATTRRQQTQTIVMITFWSQFATYALNTILILFLTRPLIARGLDFSQAKAYAFIGISQATGYLMPILGGFVADNILGVRRSILLGSILLAMAYLLVMLSGYTIQTHGDFFFIAAYALTPAANSLLIGTASSMVSHINSFDAIKAKSAMTYYYMAINVGALLATIIAPSLLDSRYGPLSVLTLTFIGKSIAALNFAYRYRIYDPVIWGQDHARLTSSSYIRVIGYLLAVYAFTLFAYSHIHIANIVISIGCITGLGWFLTKTLLLSGVSRTKQLVATFLIIEAIVFFIIYNQMNTTLVLFAQENSNTTLFGFHLSPAHYQLLNPLLIIILGFQLPRFYQAFPRFTIPYQFACGTLLAGLALLTLAYAPSHEGMVSGIFIALTYILITLAELWVSAIGLSMIGLYCDTTMLSFAMGTWYLSSSLSSTLSGQIAHWVALPKNIASPTHSLTLFQHYYHNMGYIALILGILMLIIAYITQRRFHANHMILP